MTRLPRLDRLAAVCLLACVLGGPALAQIVLPPSSSPRGNVAPHLVCSVCGTRNYTAPSNAPRDAQGRATTWCATCKRDTTQENPKTGKAAAQGGGTLVLPPRGSSPAPGAAPVPAGQAEPEPSGAPPPAPEAGEAASGAEPVAKSTAASIASLYAVVRQAAQPDERVVVQAVESLLSLGEPALAVSRLELEAEEAPVIVTAARVLARAGAEGDVERIQRRLRTRLPATAGAPMVDAVCAADPVRASPRWLVEMLESSQPGIRSAAEKHLRRQAVADTITLLEPALASKRGETRLLAVGLLAGIADDQGPTRVTGLLLEHLADPLPRVAASVVALLAGRKDPELDARLSELAFRQRWILRENAYALVTLVEREDLEVRAILDDAAAEPLLAGLQASDPFVSGACASALAGIGFRSPRPRSTGWLDRDVVDRLVHTVAAKVFYPDFSTLSGPALRRLRLLTGQDIANDGPRWLEWWLVSRPSFYARRAILAYEPEEIARVRVRHSVRGSGDQSFVLQAPEAEAPSDPYGTIGETLELSLTQARDLLAVAEREGLLGPERLPGLRGARGAGEREIELSIAGRGKVFVFGAGASEPWFERLAGAALALRDQNRWQRFTREDTASSPGARTAEAEWWAAEHTELERAQRLKALVLGALPTSRGAARDGAIQELERLYELPELAEAADFRALLGAARDEPTWSERVRKLKELALRSAQSASVRTAGAPDTARVRELAIELARTLIERFGAAASEDLAATIEPFGSAVAAPLATDPHPELRAIAARALATEGGEANVALLLRLLDDPDEKVQAAAAAEIGRTKLESGRTELLVRARLGHGAVRPAALLAVGRIGGEFALDALMLGLSDPDPAVHVAAAHGLAELADPAAIQPLIALLAQGRSSPVYAPAREGLKKLGPRAQAELLRVVHSPTHRSRREVALMIAEQGLPDATSALITLLTASPGDAQIANELAILSCVDLRAEAEPANAWWAWWDGVVHDDALAWFLGALERVHFAPPGRNAFTGTGTLEGRLFLLNVMQRPEAFLAERARRELARMLDREISSLPPRGAPRDAWIEGLRVEVQTPGAQ